MLSSSVWKKGPAAWKNERQVSRNLTDTKYPTSDTNKVHLHVIHSQKKSKRAEAVVTVGLQNNDKGLLKEM